MNDYRCYKLFNLTANSEITLPEASFSQEQTTDIEIRLEKLTESARENMQVANYWMGTCGENELWLCTPVADFQISFGNLIRVEPNPGISANNEDLRIYLLGTAMAMLQIQRGLFPLHGGSLLKNGKVLTISGDTGAGKSTVVAALSLKGLPFLSDDVSVLRVEKDCITVLPAYPQRKLCRDAAIKLGFNPDNMVRVSEEREKYVIRDASGWHSEPTALQTLVEIVPRADESVVLEQVHNMDKVALLHRNIYRSGIYPFCGLMGQLMKACLDVSSKVTMYKLYRPIDGESLDAVIAALEKI